MRKSILVLPAVAAVLTFGAGAAAQASVHPANVVGGLEDGNGTAGYYTQEFGRTYTQVNGSFKLNLPSTDQLFALENGAIGIQLCNNTSGYIAAVGVIDTNAAVPGSWSVVAISGYLAPGTDPTGDGDPCAGVSFWSLLFGHPTGFNTTVLGYLPAGTTVQAQIKEYHHVLVYTVADSNLANFNYAQWKFGGFFNEAGAGTSGDLDILSAPATNDLVDFSGVTATVSTGAKHGFAAWNTVGVASGFPGYAPLITPTAISPSSYACVPGHWLHYGKKHHHTKWVPRKCTGGGASSFSIETGSPVGV